MSKIIISKQGIDVTKINTPDKVILSSDFGNLKYFKKVARRISFDANAGDISAEGIYDHNLSYYPYVEAFVSTYIGSPTGVYEYCPFVGAGATVNYDATFRITKNQIKFYGEISGASTSVWVFDFIFFIFKNNLLF